jgi:hypothetical protein
LLTARVLAFLEAIDRAEQATPSRAN